MKHLCRFILCFLAATAGAQIEVTFRNGAVRSLPSFTVREGRLVLPDESIRVDLAQITTVQFLFEGPAEEQPGAWFAKGRADRVVELLDPLDESLTAAAALSGNGARLLGLLYKARFHRGNPEGMRAALATLRRINSPFAADADAYEILTLMAEGRVDEATRRAQDAGDLPEAAQLLIEARQAAAAGRDREALKILSRLQAFHFREAEWMPGALADEARLRAAAGEEVAAGYAAREARLFYPTSLEAQQLEQVVDLME